MPHETALIGTIVAAFVAAFLMGALAQKARISPMAGYLLAGILIGPFTPGYVADTDVALQLAEIGVILLMFGVGLHFSLKDLLSVRRIAVPGALVQIAVATSMGAGLAHLLGWPLHAGLVFGLALSVASTVVLLRALQTHGILDTERGRIAVGWLVVEDLVMVLALVLLPVAAQVVRGGDADVAEVIGAVGLTALKVAGFFAFMLLVGRRVIPWMLHWVAHTGSRELFRLAVLAIALGVAGGAVALFDVSFALGAFFAGMILGESRLSQRAAEETLPLRDAFAVLFFVSVGMLFDPRVLVQQPLAIVATVFIIVVGKSLAAFAIMKLFRHPTATAFTISASLAQIGEFSFILAALGVALGLLPAEGRDLILAGAILSILLHPALFALVEKRRAAGAPAVVAARPKPPQGHVVLVGYGRVGSLVGPRLLAMGRRLVVIEDQPDIAERARADGAEVIVGNAADPEVLALADLKAAAKLMVAIPEGFDAGQIVEQARQANAGLTIVARAHSEEEVAHLTRMGAANVVVGEREIAERMVRLAGTAAAAAAAAAE